MIEATSARPALDPALAALLEAHARAARRSVVTNGRYRVAGRIVQVHGAGACARPLVAPWAHLTETGAGPADFDLYVWDAASTGVALPPSPSPARAPWIADHRSSLVAVHEPDLRTFSAYDRDARIGVLFADDVKTFDRILPFRLILHWWLRDGGLALLHAGAIAPGDRGVLVTGRGGLGKSTTCVSALLAGWRYASDDFVAVRADADGTLVAHSVASTARVTEETLVRFPRLRAGVVDAPIAPDGKSLIQLHPAFAPNVVTRLNIAAIVVPSIVEAADSRVVPISSAEALRAAISTLTTLVGARDRAFAELAGVVQHVPCWRLDAGSDPARVLAALERVIR